MAGEGFVEQGSVFSEPVDVESGPGLWVFVESEVPKVNFVFEFHLAPGHSTYAIANFPSGQGRAAQTERYQARRGGREEVRSIPAVPEVPNCSDDVGALANAESFEK